MNAKILITPRTFGKEDPFVFQMMEEAGITAVLNTTNRKFDSDTFLELLKDCDGAIVGTDLVTAEVMDSCPKLRTIAKYGVGIDNIDVEAAKARHISVSRTVGANAIAVADYTMGLLLAAARGITKYDRQVRAGNTQMSTMLDVTGKTLGVIGMGMIGKLVAERARRGFDMKILGYDAFWDEDYAEREGITYANLDDILIESDFITLHVPLLPETQNLIDERALRLMKPTAVLLNAARGGVVDEQALMTALRERQIYAAGIDVFSTEPKIDAAWATLDNVIISPHCAGQTVGATERMGRMAVENVIRDLGIQVK